MQETSTDASASGEIGSQPAEVASRDISPSWKSGEPSSKSSTVGLFRMHGERAESVHVACRTRESNRAARTVMGDPKGRSFVERKFHTFVPCAQQRLLESWPVAQQLVERLFLLVPVWLSLSVHE